MARIGGRIDACGVLMECHEGKSHLEGVDGKVLLHWILRSGIERHGLD